MDAHRRPPPRDALSNERARELALAEVLRMEEAKKETQVFQPPRKTTAGRAVLAGVLFVAALWLWAWPPAALSIEPDYPVPSETRVRASLRVAIALQVDRIDAFRDANGRLPDELIQLGEDAPAITYTRDSARAYRISARSDGLIERYASGESLEVFVRSALQTLRGSDD